MLAQKRRKHWGNSPKFKMPKNNDGPSTSSNRFNLLADDDKDDEFFVKEKVPPIIVDPAHNFSKVIGFIGDKYIFKRMSIGTKIISSSMALYEEALKALKEMKFHYYTHELKNTKCYKLVLFGLPRLDVKDINDEFITRHNITPVSIKEIQTKRSNEDDTLYLIEFDRSHVSKSEVMKIRYFSNIAVFWRKPLKGNKGPTQCAKCSMYGHGSNNCNRLEVCAACAGNHNIEACPLNKGPQVGSVVFKCHNCSKKNMRNVNHRADDPKCPCRQEYLEIRQKVSSRARVPVTRSKSVSFDTNKTYFPSLSNFEPQIDDSRPHSKNLYSDVIKGKSFESNDDDISNDKLLEIFFEAVDALQRCQNKYDKLRVLGMMLKHAI